MKLLVIEDEPKTGEFLRKGLSESGFVVDIARNGVDGLHLAREGGYDLVLLDVTLPGMDGWHVLKQLRRDSETPVMFLTARDRVEERVKGLELGADDYLVKPFAFSELLARVRTLLRRPRRGAGPIEPEQLRAGDLEVDVLRHKVRRGDRRIQLTAKEFLLLLLFMRRQGEVLSRTLIAEQVWDMNFDSDTNVVDVAVRRLRAKIDDPFTTKLLHTLRGVGYVLEAREDEPVAGGAERERAR
jgi:two-component system copper resistance phosphate regulon response regulator CusR